MTRVYTLIGDIVGSRRLNDRAGAQERIGTVLREVSPAVRPVQDLEATVGDEFQGAFRTVGDAALAALLVRLALLPDVDVRCGLGYGEVTVHDGDRRPLLQDGPGWWSARDALDALSRPRRAAERTWYVGPDAGRVNAFLLTRDALVDRLGTAVTGCSPPRCAATARPTSPRPRGSAAPRSASSSPGVSAPYAMLIAASPSRRR